MTTDYPPKPQPMQPVYRDEEGTVRFHENEIVRYLLDHGGIDMNQLAQIDFPPEDREQFAQLIGYPIEGYHELSYVSNESCAQASALASAVVPGAGGCRDAGCAVHGGPLIDDDGKRLA